MSNKPIREFSLPRHYTHFGNYGRYEVKRQGKVYKHSYIWKDNNDGEIEELAERTSFAVEQFKTRASNSSGRNFQIETNFKYEVEGEEYDYTIKTPFVETIEEAEDYMEFQMEEGQKKFIVSGIKRFIRGDYLLNIIRY